MIINRTDLANYKRLKKCVAVDEKKIQTLEKKQAILEEEIKGLRNGIAPYTALIADIEARNPLITGFIEEKTEVPETAPTTEDPAQMGVFPEAEKSFGENEKSDDVTPTDKDVSLFN